MDVRCSRCGTDYEFDDTLISERGTTVKCTNCSYQFKIFPPKSAATAPERWVVLTATGSELVYTSLRELQRGIADKKVGPNDLLSRGRNPARPLGSIPELEPFFVNAQNAPSHGMSSPARTLHGVAPPPSGAPRPERDDRPTSRGIGRQGGTKGATPVAKIETKTVTVDPAAAEAEPATIKFDSAGPNTQSALTSTLPLSNSAPVTGYSQRLAEPRILGAVAPTEREPVRPPPKPRAQPPAAPPEAAPPPASVRTTMPLGTNMPSFDTTLPAAPPPTFVEAARQPAAELSSSAQPPEATTQPLGPRFGGTAEGRAGASASGTLDTALPVASPRAVARPQPSNPLQPTPPPPPISTRERLPSYDETPHLDVEPGRRARTRWIVGLVFLAVAGLLGLTVGRQYAARFTSKQASEGGARDERSSKFLTDGTKLADQADYEGAQESLAKAQALADRDPAVLAAVARLETLRADQSWLKLRLLDPTSTAIVQATQRELGRRVGKARQAVDAAFALSPEDPVVTRARVDAMRIAGEEKRAREWIAPVAANATEPQNAYVLAALDLAEAAPAWTPVIDRLRTAAVSEREASRGRAALVYALVRAGRVSEAETELAKIAAAERPHPLLDELTGFVNRFKAPADAGADAAPAAEKDAGASALDPKRLPEPDTSPAPAGAEEKLPAGDFRTRLTLAAKASASGELERARTLYQSVLSEQPGNTEALSGLADVARKRGDTPTAQKMYAKVLEANPSYLPALMASADTKWDAGDRHGAVALYKRIVEQVGTSSDYGRRAQARINQGEGEPASTGAGSPAPGAAPKTDDAGTETPP
jgi:predicted Zn finger-like uncharacterized protein